MAEWLGRGLQSLVRRFESGSRLFAVVVRDVAAPATFHVSPVRAVPDAARRSACEHGSAEGGLR
jgi:hypothetical protein